MLLLAPFAPHITDELWSQLGNEGSIHIAEWPTWDDELLVQDTVTIVVQVNGKVRAQLQLPAGATKEQALEAAQANENVQSFVSGKDIRKEIFIPGKILNLVV